MRRRGAFEVCSFGGLIFLAAACGSGAPSTTSQPNAGTAGSGGATGGATGGAAGTLGTSAGGVTGASGGSSGMTAGTTGTAGGAAGGAAGVTGAGGTVAAAGTAGASGTAGAAGASADAGADVAPAIDGAGAPTGKNILMVVGDSNETNPVGSMGSPKGTGPGDVFLKNRLQSVLGHKVTMLADTTAKPMLLQAANAADLVILCESLLSGNVLTALKPTTTPVLSYEAFLQDDMGLVDPSGKVFPTTAAGGCDPGTPPACTYGTLVADHMTIVNPAHPLAAGLTGSVKLYTTPGNPATDPGGLEVNWGKVGPGAEIIATMTGFPTAATFYVYHKGATLFDGTKAAALRMQLWFEDDNATGTLNFSTPEGFKLFDNAVSYALTTP
jgi:hypothetical protein